MVLIPPYLAAPALPRTSPSWSDFGQKMAKLETSLNHCVSHLDVKWLWNIGDSKVNEFADAEDKVLKDDDKEKPQGKYIPGRCNRCKIFCIIYTSADENVFCKPVDRSEISLMVAESSETQNLVLSCFYLDCTIILITHSHLFTNCVLLISTYFLKLKTYL